MRTPRRQFQPLALTLALLLLAAACGVGTQASPERLAAEDVPDGLLDPNPPTSLPAPPTPETTPASVYFIQSQGDTEQLAAVEREVTDPGDLRERLTVLLQQGPTSNEQAEQSLVTYIPADTALNPETRVHSDRALAVIDLSPEFYDATGADQRAAFAQIVFTATAVDGVEQVRFRVDGDDIQALRADSTSARTVTREDYDAFREGASTS